MSPVRLLLSARLGEMVPGVPFSGGCDQYESSVEMERQLSPVRILARVSPHTLTEDPLFQAAQRNSSSCPAHNGSFLPPPEAHSLQRQAHRRPSPCSTLSDSPYPSCVLGQGIATLQGPPAGLESIGVTWIPHIWSGPKVKHVPRQGLGAVEVDLNQVCHPLIYLSKGYKITQHCFSLNKRPDNTSEY